MRARLPDVFVSVSATTRPRRPGEVDGVHYHFLTADDFEKLVAAGGLLEWAEFSGRRYGTPAAPVRTALDAGRTVILEIDVQGARQVRERLPDSTLVFLKPPDMDTLRRRLAARGTESREAIERRLQMAQAEMAEADWFDHVVINDDIDAAAEQVARILQG